MRFFLISDNTDTQTGMRLAGIEGVVAHTAEEVTNAFELALAQPDIQQHCFLPDAWRSPSCLCTRAIDRRPFSAWRAIR